MINKDEVAGVDAVSCLYVLLMKFEIKDFHLMMGYGWNMYTARHQPQHKEDR